MLYLIGGTSRSGKTALAGRLLRRRQVPFLSVDALKMALHDTMPDRFPPVLAPAELAAAIRPLLRGIGMHAVTQGSVYCLEGDLLAPGDVAEFERVLPGTVRACFLGYPAISTARKLELIERYPGHPIDWVNRDLDRAAKIAHIERMKRDGREVERVCRALGVPFVDTSADFEASLEQAYRILVGDPQAGG